MQSDVIGGRYRTQRVIGRGGMGTVWLAQDVRLGRQVAVKQVGLLPGDTTPDGARAMREARSTAALSHRNVVTVYDVVEEDDSIWLVMEHVPSRSLAEIIAEDGPLSPVEAARIGAEVADGLAAAHEAGIVHRDVKPGNILLRHDGIAKISDFGIARPAGDPALTQSGMFVGTPSYLSPEAARGETPTPASDVWSLGATLYAAVEGQPPYPSSSNQLAVLNRIAEEDPAPPGRAGPLAPVLSRMLERDVGARWSMADAAHVLRRVADRGDPGTLALTLQDREGYDADPAGGTDREDTVTAPVVVDEPDRRRRRVTPLLVGLLALGVVAAGLLLLDPGDSSPPSAGTGPSVSPSGPAPSAEESQKADGGEGPTEGSDASSPTPSSSPGRAKAVAAFIRQYFDTVTEDTDAGWSMLGPGMRSVGRDSYESWWGGVEDVEVRGISPARSGEVADVTLTYTMQDGRVETERHRLDLLRSRDGWLINGDQAI